MTATGRKVLTALVVLLAATSGIPALAIALPAGPTDAGVDAPKSASSATTTATVVDGNGTSIVTDGEKLVLETARNQTIRGETSLPAGTNLSINVQGETFLMSESATVTDRRTFAATFDLSTVGPAKSNDVTVKVYRDETVLAEVDARLVCENDCASESTDDDDEAVAGDEPALQEGITEVGQNRTAAIDVLFGGAETVTVSIGGPEVNYVINGTIRDRDGDGNATVLFHTSRAGTDAPTLAVVDDGETRIVRTNTETSLDSPLAPGTYEVRLYAGEDATDELRDVGQIIVFEAADDGTSVSDAPANATATVGSGDANTSGANGSRQFLGGFGLIAVGGVLAVIGVAVVLGLLRT